MRRFIPIFIITTLIVLAFSCNKEKKLQQNLTGGWTVYKYAQHSFDYTAQFDSVFNGYKIIFSGSNQFVETYNLKDTIHNTYTPIENSGTYAFKNNDLVLALMDSVIVTIDSLNIPTIQERDYTIFDLSGQYVQLLTDTSDIYLTKQ